MIKKIALILTLFMSSTGVSFAGSTSAADSNVNDGTNDTIEAWGGTRNGGDC